MSIKTGLTDLKGLVALGLLDAIADGLLVCDESGIILAVNRRVEELSGYDESQLLGEPVEMLVPHSLGPTHQSHRDYFSTSGHPTRAMGSGLDTRLVTKSGSEIPVDIALAPLRTDSGVFVITGVRDVTARRRRERSIGAVREVSEAILKGRSEHAIHALISQSALELSEAEVALVALKPTHGREFVVQAAAGVGEKKIVGASLRDDFWDDTGQEEGHTVDLGGFEHLRAMIGRPLGPIVVIPLAEGQGLGFLIVIGAVDRQEFDNDQLTLLETFASHAAIASARGRRMRTDAVAGDRDRIARDLHDLIIQRLFGAGLSLQVIAQTYGENPELYERLTAVIEMLDMSIAELRRSIFELEQRNRVGMRDRIRITIDEMMAGQDIETAVHISDDSFELADDKAAQLLATLREALSNARRHALASRVEVSIAVSHDLVLEVSDDGSGIPDTVTMGHGLSNMAKRARQLGGELDLSTSPAGGLLLRWSVPNDPPLSEG